MKAIFILGALALCTPAQAEYLSGTQFATMLASKRTGDRALASGYLAGVHDTTRGAIHCTPIALDQPDAHTTSADILILDYLKSNYPCVTATTGSRSQQPT